MRKDQVTVDVVADTSAFEHSMQALSDATRDFGRVFTNTISSSIRSGRGFDDFLNNLGRRFSDLALSKALKPLEDLFSNFIDSLLSSFLSTIPGMAPGFAKGGAFGQSGVVPFARGGVVSSPALFNFGNRLGVMGEAGPEAILPLKRGSDGKLGVASGGGGGGPVSVVFNVQATDAASFRKSEGQISTMLARVVRRGSRSL